MEIIHIKGMAAFTSNHHVSQGSPNYVGRANYFSLGDMLLMDEPKLSTADRNKNPMHISTKYFCQSQNDQHMLLMGVVTINVYVFACMCQCDMTVGIYMYVHIVYIMAYIYAWPVHLQSSGENYVYLWIVACGTRPINTRVYNM